MMLIWRSVANKLKTVFCLPCNFFAKVVTTAIPSNHDVTLKRYGVQNMNCHFFTFSCCFKPDFDFFAEQREDILNVSVFLLDAIQVKEAKQHWTPLTSTVWTEPKEMILKITFLLSREESCQV